MKFSSEKELNMQKEVWQLNEFLFLFAKESRVSTLLLTILPFQAKETSTANHENRF